jgi:nucleoid DNA-binding protein
MNNNKALNDIIDKVAIKNNINKNVVEAVLLSEFKVVKNAIENVKDVKVPYIAKFIATPERVEWINEMRKTAKLRFNKV